MPQMSLEDFDDQDMRDADTLHKEKNTQYADARCHARKIDKAKRQGVFTTSLLQ